MKRQHQEGQENDLSSEKYESILSALQINSESTELNLGGEVYNLKDVLALSSFLQNNTVLKRLALNNAYIECEGAKYIGHALIGNATLKELDLSYNCIENKGVELIVDALKVNTTLKDLDLTGTKTGQSILYLLQGNTTLETLHLGEPGCVNISCLAEGLKVNTTLKYLGLQSCEFDSTTMRILFEGLKINTTIQGLSFELSDIGENIEYLLESLENKNITKLILSTTEITSKGVGLLAEYLQKCPNIKMLDLSSNSKIDDLAEQNILEIMGKTSLVNLQLGDIDFSDELVTYLQKAELRNPNFLSPAFSCPYYHEPEKYQEIFTFRRMAFNYYEQYKQLGEKFIGQLTIQAVSASVLRASNTDNQVSKFFINMVYGFNVNPEIREIICCSVDVPSEVINLFLSYFYAIENDKCISAYIDFVDAKISFVDACKMLDAQANLVQQPALSIPQ